MTPENGKITIEIDGERFEVASPDNNVIGQADHKGFDVRENGNGIYQVQDGDTVRNIKINSFDLNGLSCSVEIDGQVKQVRIIRELDMLIEKMGMNSSNAKKQSLVVAPMPGLVTSIKVAAGDHVEKGTPLLILEAMKMENVISAPHEAVIKEIKVNVGQAIERGLPLVEFIK